jgi:hypothetical protein
VATQAPPPAQPQEVTHAATEALINHAAEQMVKGSSNDVIVNDLISRGVSRGEAQDIVGQLRAVHSRAMKEAGQRNMVVGALFFFGGLAVTVLTFSMSTGAGGILAYGAIIGGAIQFCRGLYQQSQ